MALLLKPLTKATLGVVAAGAMAISASPANARDRYDRDNDGIGAGEIIAGAIVLGGLAAILSSGSRNDRYDNRYDDRRYDNRYDQRRYGGSRNAVEQCVRASESRASRQGYGRARVTQVTDVRRKKGGYEVRGNLVVNDNRRGYGRYDNRYDRSDRYDRRRGYDNGSFKCRVRYGRIDQLKVRGIG